MQDVVHAPPNVGGARLEEVEGFTSVSAMKSLVTAAGALRIDPIDGVRYRLAWPVSLRHGHLTEVFRTDWGLTDAPLVQVNVTNIPRPNPGLGNSSFYRPPPVCGDRLTLHRLL